jgi:hypothetical protein
MTLPRIVYRIIAVVMFALLLGFYWLIAAACDLASPRLKWFVFPAMLAMCLVAWTRSFARGVDKYRRASEAYIRRQIDTAGLPQTFRFIREHTTLHEVTERLGPASRVIELPVRHRDGDIEHFKIHEYDLPYDAAVLVMPQRPFEPDDPIRAVYMRPAPKDDWLHHGF